MAEQKGLWKKEILGNSDLQISRQQRGPAPRGKTGIAPSQEAPSYQDVPALPQEYTPTRVTGYEDTKLPKFWDARARALFNSLDDNGKRAWMDSFKLQEKSFNKAVSAMKEDLDAAEGIRPLMEFLSPYIMEVEAKGWNFETYLKGLFDADAMLARAPMTAIHKIMQITNVSLRDLELSQGQFYQDMQRQQDMVPIEDRLRQMEHDKLMDAEQREKDDVQDLIASFQNATDRDGNFLYPYSTDPDVRDAMSKIIAVQYGPQDALDTSDLPHIYHDACVALGIQTPRGDDMRIDNRGAGEPYYAPSYSGEDDVIQRRIANWQATNPQTMNAIPYEEGE